MKRMPMALTLAALLAATATGVVAAQPRVAARTHAPANAVHIQFGRTGGNIRPFAITVSETGAIKSTGMAAGNAHISPLAVAGLLQLARAEKFWSLPAHLAGTGLQPDVATLYISISTSTHSRTVTEHAARNAHFDQLFAVLQAVSGAGT